MVRRFRSAGSTARVFKTDVLDQLAPAASVVSVGSSTWYPNGDDGSNAGGGASAVAAPTLTIVDNADGTGAVATVAGATVGTTNTVYVSNWPLTTFTSGGSRTSDGEVALTLSNGPHLAYISSALSGVTNVSNMVHFRTTDTDEAVWKECLDATRDMIIGLSISGLDSDSVVVRKLPWNREPLSEGVFIHPVTERYGKGTNVRDDIGYGVQVTMIKASNQNLTSNLNTVLTWRRTISSALRRGVSTFGVAEVYNLTIEPAAVYLPEAFLKNYDVGAVLVRCHSREPLTV